MATYYQKGGSVVRREDGSSPGAGWTVVSQADRPDLYGGSSSGGPTTPPPTSAYKPPVISPNIISPLTSGQYDPLGAKDYITGQVRTAYGLNESGQGSSEAQEAFWSTGQKQINDYLAQLQNKTVDYSGQTYKYGIGGQATRLSTPLYQTNVTRTGMSSTTTALNSYKYKKPDGSTGIVQASSPEEALRKAPGIATDSGVQLIKTPTTTPISNPITPPATGGNTPSPKLPGANAGNMADVYTQSLTAQIQSYKDLVQKEADKRAADYQTKIDELDNRMKELQILQDEGMEGNLRTVQEETRAKKEALDLEKQRFDENYNANQTLITELDGLLTEGNQVVKQMKETTGLSSIMSPRIAKTMSDIEARTGVIKAVLAARDGQMTNAQNQLSSTVNALESIATDQINYYNTLVDFYQNQKTEVKDKLVTLNNEQKDYLDIKLGLLNDDLKRLHDTADIISKALVDPEKARIYGSAGVSLNDTPEQINEKLSAYAYSQEVKDISNKMATSGYTQVPIKGVNPTVVTDSAGNKTNWYKKEAGFELSAGQTRYDAQGNIIASKAPKSTSGESTQPLSILDVQRYQELYPDAGVVAGDTEAQANAKVQALNSPDAQLRVLIVSAKDEGNSYDVVANEIKNDNTIKDKNTALAIAKEVYGVEESADPKIESDIARIRSQYSNLPDGADQNDIVKRQLEQMGYTNEEIINSSVGSGIDKFITGISNFLFK